MTKKFLDQNIDGKFILITVPFEGNVSFGKGASNGCNHILNSSLELEPYESEFNTFPIDKGIKTLNLNLKNNSVEEMIKKLADIIRMNLRTNRTKEIANSEKNVKEAFKKDFKENFADNKFIIVLGGDHSIGLGVLEGLKKESFSVLQLDAHPDFFYSWNNSKFNHRCFGYKAHSVAKNLVQVGIRTMDFDEQNLIEKNKILSITAKDFQKNRRSSIKKILDKLSENVYISIDVDVFDPSLIRNTGTPEPGGLFWNETIELLEKVFKNKKVLIVDISEFASSDSKNDVRIESYILANLIYKIFSLNIKYKK